ncbi:hypothetical protein TPA0909_56730 [Streptomyces albus]|nr:hypothetical protein TPA0909_56730 [Streptomyces albus]
MRGAADRRRPARNPAPCGPAGQPPLLRSPRPATGHRRSAGQMLFDSGPDDRIAFRSPVSHKDPREGSAVTTPRLTQRRYLDLRRSTSTGC